MGEKRRERVCRLHSDSENEMNKRVLIKLIKFKTGTMIRDEK